jgi:hypothetical protein
MKKNKHQFLDMNDEDLSLILSAGGVALSKMNGDVAFQCRDMEGGGAGLRVLVEKKSKKQQGIRRLVIDFASHKFQIE